MNIAEKIQDLRKKSGLSQEQLAEKLGVSRQAVSKWEGSQSSPDIEKIALMSQLFGVSTDYLIKGEEPSQTQTSAEHPVDIVHVSQKLFIIDANKRKLAAFDEFGIDMIGLRNHGEAEFIGGKESCKVKVPVCLIYGISKGIFGINKRVVLGYYGTLEDAQKELESLSAASRQGSSYTLKYAAVMSGVHIVE